MMKLKTDLQNVKNGLRIEELVYFIRNDVFLSFVF